MIDYVAFVSYGNDSIALMQWARENRDGGNPGSLVCAHSDTGWASPEWNERVLAGEAFAKKCGFQIARLSSVGMQDLVRKKKGWPRQGMQFCTTHLKIEPAKKWLDKHDPGKEADCLVGVRRAESTGRSSWPEWVEESENHGGRSLWSPLVRLTDEDRNKLVERAGFAVLKHRSQECYPCVNANRADLRMLSASRVDEIEAFEKELGFTSKNKPRTMFRPYRHQGASGIREVIRWAQSDRGKYRQLVVLSNGSGCDSGMCTE